MSGRPDTLFAEIYREHRGILGCIAQAFAPSAADRDELFQDMLVAVWNACEAFSSNAKLSTYVYRVSLSCALNWKRSRVRYAQRLAQFSQIPAAADDGSFNQDQERLAWLYDRIRELPTVDRAVMLLALDRVPYGEMATITGLTESNIGVRLHRIKQQLAAKMQETKNELR